MGSIQATNNGDSLYCFFGFGIQTGTRKERGCKIWFPSLVWEMRKLEMFVDLFCDGF